MSFGSHSAPRLRINVAFPSPTLDIIGTKVAVNAQKQGANDTPLGADRVMRFEGKYMVAVRLLPMFTSSQSSVLVCHLNIQKR